jgi:hypothetical protein
MTKKQQEDATETNALRTEADRRMSAAEAIAIGEPFGAALNGAARTIAALETAAHPALFPRFVNATADTLALLDFHEGGWLRPHYAESAAELHRACLDEAPQLAAMLRSAVVIDRLVDCHPERPDAEDLYRRAIAEQLVGRDDFEPYASVIAVDVPALHKRIEVCRQRHDAHQHAEFDRVRRARQEEADAIAAETQRRRDEVARFFLGRNDWKFIVRGSTFSGGTLASAAKKNGIRNQESGDIVRPPLTLDELEDAMRRHLAGDAA